MRHPPNLQTAIKECDRLGIVYSFKDTKNSHIKFYIGDRMLTLSRNNDNPDRVRRDIKRLDTAIRV